jgi:hypothetical protein
MPTKKIRGVYVDPVNSFVEVIQDDEVTLPGGGKHLVPDNDLYYTMPHKVTVVGDHIDIEGNFPLGSTFTTDAGGGNTFVYTTTHDHETALEVAAQIAGLMIDGGADAVESSSVSNGLVATVTELTTNPISCVLSNDTDVAVPANIKAILAAI